MSDESLLVKIFPLILETKWASGFLYWFQYQEGHLLLILESQFLVEYCNLLKNSKFGGKINQL